MKKRKNILLVILVIVLSLTFTSCAGKGNNGDNGKEQDVATNHEKQSLDYNELIKNATLQYPSSNDEYAYNVYKDNIYNYDCFVEITGLSNDNSKNISQLKIPEKIENYNVVAVDGFDGCPNLIEAIIPNTVLCVSEGCFSNDSKLSKIVFSNNLQYIKKNAFFGANLGTIEFPKTLISIGEEAFSHNYGLQTIKYNDGIKRIGYQAFAFCSNVEEIEFPESLERIGEEAFVCTIVNKIIIKSKNVSIGTEAFELYNISEENIPDIEFYGYAGSTLAQYCLDYNHKFIVINE